MVCVWLVVSAGKGASSCLRALPVPLFALGAAPFTRWLRFLVTTCDFIGGTTLLGEFDAGWRCSLGSPEISIDASAFCSHAPSHPHTILEENQNCEENCACVFIKKQTMKECTPSTPRDPCLSALKSHSPRPALFSPRAPLLCAKESRPSSSGQTLSASSAWPTAATEAPSKARPRR